MYNHVQSLNYKVFNKIEYKEYKSSFLTIKKELENKFTELENKKILANLKNSELMCNEILEKHYKIINDEYDKENTDEFLEDYKNFLNAYEKEAKGNNKIKCLINFLEINKPKYFNCILYNKKRKEIGKSDTFDKNENIEEMRIKLNRKKREIDNLKNDVKKLEDDIKKAQSLENDASSKQFQSIQNSNN